MINLFTRYIKKLSGTPEDFYLEPFDYFLALFVTVIVIFMLGIISIIVALTMPGSLVALGLIALFGLMSVASYRRQNAD